MDIRAIARRKDLLAEAEGQRAMIDAENKIDRHIATMKVDLARLEALPRVVAEMVKPAEKIESIRINHLSGLGGGHGGAGKPPLNQAIDSIMEMAVQMPALRKIGEELAMDFDGGIAGFAARTLNAGKDEAPQEPKKS